LLVPDLLHIFNGWMGGTEIPQGLGEQLFFLSSEKYLCELSKSCEPNIREVQKVHLLVNSQKDLEGQPTGELTFRELPTVISFTSKPVQTFIEGPDEWLSRTGLGFHSSTQLQKTISQYDLMVQC
jgi:hypothetical protein